MGGPVPSDQPDGGGPVPSVQPDGTQDDHPMEIGATEINRCHIGGKTARSLGLINRQPDVRCQDDTNYVELCASRDSLPSTRRSGSAEGWLPRTDEAATPKPQCDHAQAGLGVAPSQAGENQAPMTSVPDVVPMDEPMMLFMVQQFGGRPSYNRERRANARRMVTEVFSPPRITRMLERFPSRTGKLHQYLRYSPHHKLPL